jgi:hypothetical protein
MFDQERFSNIVNPVVKRIGAMVAIEINKAAREIRQSDPTASPYTAQGILEELIILLQESV